MKAQNRRKASAHAPIVELAAALRRTGPDQLDELLETPMDDPEQLRTVRIQLGLLQDLAAAAFLHVRQLEDGDAGAAGSVLSRETPAGDEPIADVQPFPARCQNCGTLDPRMTCAHCIRAAIEQLTAPRLPAAPFTLAELENVQPRPWRVAPVVGDLASVIDSQDVTVLSGVTPEEAALIVRTVNAAP